MKNRTIILAYGKMKLFYKSIKIVQYLLIVISMGLLCSCISDVSQNPQYNYGFIYNHVYKTIDEILLHKDPSSKNLYFLEQMGDVAKEYRYNYLSTKGKMVILPKGTLFRVEQLIRDINPEQSTLFVKVRILNGHFKNIQATCFLQVDKYTNPIERDKSYKELRLIAKIPDPAVVIDLGEMPEYKDEKSIPEPEPITYTP